MLYSRISLEGIVNTLGQVCKQPINILLYGLLFFSFTLERVEAKNNILVIHSWHPESPQTKKQQAAISQGFTELNNKNNVFHEFLAVKRHPNSEYRQEFINYLNQKYRLTDIDLLLVVNESSLDLILEQHKRLFSEVPVVFMGVSNIRQEIYDTPWLTGVLETYATKDTIKEATRQMWSNTVVVVNDSTNSGKANLERINQIADTNQNLNIKLENDIFAQDIENRLGKYKDNIPILLLGQLRQNDSQKSLIDPKQDIEILKKQFLILFILKTQFV